MLQEFAALRERLVEEEAEWEGPAMTLPHPRDTSAWEKLCFGEGSGRGVERVLADEGEEGVEGGEGAGEAGSSSGSGGMVGGMSAASSGAPGPIAGALQLAAGGAAGPSGADAPSLTSDGGGGGEGGFYRGDDGAWRYPADLHAPPHFMTRVIMSMDQVEVAELLRRHVTRLETLRAAAPLTCQWLFALSAKLDKPVHAETAAAFRSMLRRFAAWRARAGGPGERMLPHWNVMIAIAGAYYGQDEALSRAVADLELL